MLEIFQMITQSKAYAKLLKLLPTLIIILTLGGLAYFGYEYLAEMRVTVEATKKQSELLQAQLEEVKKANQAIAEDMKGVKELTDTFNTQLTSIRTNQTQLTSVVTSQKFKTTVTTNVPAAQDSLNQSFNKLFNSINGATNAK